MTIAAPPLLPRRRVPGNRWSAPLQPDPDGRWPIHAHVTVSCPADGASRRRADTPAAGCSGNRRGQWAQWFVAPGWVLAPGLPLQRSGAPEGLEARLAFRPLAAWPVAWPAPVVSLAWAWGPQGWVALPAQVRRRWWRRLCNRRRGLRRCRRHWRFGGGDHLHGDRHRLSDRRQRLRRHVVQQEKSTHMRAQRDDADQRNVTFAERWHRHFRQRRGGSVE